MSTEQCERMSAPQCCMQTKAFVLHSCQTNTFHQHCIQFLKEGGGNNMDQPSSANVYFGQGGWAAGSPRHLCLNREIANQHQTDLKMNLPFKTSMLTSTLAALHSAWKRNRQDDTAVILDYLCSRYYCISQLYFPTSFCWTSCYNTVRLSVKEIEPFIPILRWQVLEFLLLHQHGSFKAQV